MNLKFRTLYFEITHGCNQSCKHCYLDGGIHHKIIELSTEQIKKILFEFKGKGGEYVIITGGEPTVRSDLFNILDYIDSLNIPFQLASNCILLNDTKLNKLITYKNLDFIFTSLLGTTKEEHCYISGKDNFDHVFSCLEFFDKHNVKTYVQVTLAKDYINDAMEIVDKLSSFKLCTIKVTPIADIGIKTGDKLKKQLVLPESRYEEFLVILQEIKKKYKNKIEEPNLWTREQLENVINDYIDNELYCLKYLYLVVRPNGTKSFSFYVDNAYTFGNVLEGMSVENDEKLQEYISVLRKIDQDLLKYASNKVAINYDYLVNERIKRYDFSKS